MSLIHTVNLPEKKVYKKEEKPITSFNFISIEESARDAYKERSVQK